MMKKNVLHHWGFITIAVFALLGCTRVAENSSTPSPISTMTPISSFQSETSEISSVTPNPPSDINVVDYRCITISDDFKQLGNPNGTLVLNGYITVLRNNAKSISNPLLLFNMNSTEEISVPVKESVNHFTVSPDGAYLAFDIWKDNTNKWQINILDATGNTVSTVDAEALGSFEWLDDKNLLINSLSEKFEHNPLIWSSPFDHKEKLIEPFVSAAERIMPIDSELLHQWGFYAYHKIIYNPTFTRAIYASSDEDGSTVIFRNLESNQDISVVRVPAWGQSPKWSPDGTKLAVGINTDNANRLDKYELAVFDGGGKQLYITHLSTPSEPVYISSLSWSPDGGKIAFWYTTNEDVNLGLRLAIFDLSIQKVIDYCITKDSPYYRWHTNDKSPIWSPDGTDLLIETANGDIPNSVVINLVSEKAVIIKDSYEPVGWMK